MSSIFRLSWQDLVKGLVVSVLSSTITVILSILNNGGTLNKESLALISVVALSSGLGYILKQLATDENGKIVGKI